MRLLAQCQIRRADEGALVTSGPGGSVWPNFGGGEIALVLNRGARGHKMPEWRVGGMGCPAIEARCIGKKLF